MPTLQVVKSSISSALLLVTVVSPSALSQSAPTAVRTRPDMDSIVAIDGHVVGRVGAGKEAFFPLGAGRHTVAAATLEGGDYWEQGLEVLPHSSVLIEIPLRKAHLDHQNLSNEISALQTEVDDKQKALADVNSQINISLHNADDIRNERHLIVQAIEHYANHYKSQLRLRDALKTDATQFVRDAARPPQNPSTGMSNAEAYTKSAEYFFAFVSWLVARHHEASARRIRDRMHILEQDLKDPFKNPRVPGQDDYLTTIRHVTKKNVEAQLITGPDRIEYRAANEDIKLSCKERPRARGGRKVTIRYVESDRRKPKKHHKRTIHLTATNKKEGKLLATDIFLACPKE